jgi:hypothetical protein
MLTSMRIMEYQGNSEEELLCKLAIRESRRMTSMK